MTVIKIVAGADTTCVVWRFVLGVYILHIGE